MLCNAELRTLLNLTAETVEERLFLSYDTFTYFRDTSCLKSVSCSNFKEHFAQQTTLW